MRTTISDSQAPCPLDKVNRQFRAERLNQLWVSDFTYVSTWQGWQYVAFVWHMQAGPLARSPARRRILLGSTAHHTHARRIYASCFLGSTCAVPASFPRRGPLRAGLGPCTRVEATSCKSIKAGLANK